MSIIFYSFPNYSINLYSYNKGTENMKSKHWNSKMKIQMMKKEKHMWMVQLEKNELQDHEMIERSGIKRRKKKTYNLYYKSSCQSQKWHYRMWMHMCYCIWLSICLCYTFQCNCIKKYYFMFLSSTVVCLF